MAHTGMIQGLYRDPAPKNGECKRTWNMKWNLGLYKGLVGVTWFYCAFW